MMNDRTKTNAGASGKASLPFGEAEYRVRKEAVLAEMDRQSIDVMVISTPSNCFYLTGMRAGVIHYLFVLALTRKGEGVWIARRNEMSNVRAMADVSWTREGTVIEDSADPYEALARALSEIAAPNATIGLELGSPIPTAAGVRTMQKSAPHARIVDSSGIIEKLRAVKSSAELNYMRAAGRISGNAIRYAVGRLRRGTTDAELAANLIGEAIRLGSESMSLGPYVTTGQRSYMAHSSWAHVPIRENELINTELAAVVARYNTPIFRVSVIGTPSDELRRFHDASLAGLRAGLERIKPGMTSHEGDRIVRDAIDKAGYGDYFPVRAAYSIGVGFPPMWSENHVMSIRPNDQRILHPGMCFHLVPALYKAELGCVCCSYPICITETGVEPLTDIPAELMVVD